jgi:FKBP-type peptidyl-prolyl cis-trans isomerase 2
VKRGLAAALFLLAACSRGPVVPGSTVTLDYELTVGGAIIESTAGRKPLVIVQGAGSLPPAVDQALLGLKPKDELVLDLTPKTSGFGPSDRRKITQIPLARFGALAKDLKVGGFVDGVSRGKPQSGRVTAIDIEDGLVTLDFNHFLAGKNLRYKLKIISVR